MAQQQQTVQPTPGVSTDLIGGDRTQAGKPSDTAAAAAGAVGPGALAAAETRIEASKAGGRDLASESGSGLSKEDIEFLRGVVKRMGGTDAFIRWLELHRDL